MNLKRIISHRLHLFIIILILVNILGYSIWQLFSKVRESSNQRAITQTLTFLNNHPTADGRPALEQLLRLKSLTTRQKAAIYNKLSVDFFLQNQMQDFLKTVGTSIFYNEEAGDEEMAIYQYALLTQFYLSIGADKSGFETILTARRMKNFYKIQDPIIRSQALHAYGRFLVSESDFEDALKAEKQLEEDAALIMQDNPSLGIQNQRRALCFKAYILMQQGKIEAVSDLIPEILNRYYHQDEFFNHVAVYDFLLPLFWVQTQYAIRTGNFDDAIRYCRQYCIAAKKYDFIMKAVSITKEVMFVLPPEMKGEWEIMYEALAADTDRLAQIFLGNYTSITGSQLFTTLQGLRYTKEQQNARGRLAGTLFISFLVVLSFSLVLLFVYSETQIDGLTKLRNRRALNTKLTRFAATGKKYSAIMIDIDDFKRLNDSFGHAFGDCVLREVAGKLIAAENHHVKCYRYGGEEIVIILEHFDLEHAVKLAERLRTEISMMQWEKDVHVTASFGLGVELPDPVKEADENMYVAKQKGKNFTAYRRNGTQYLAERRLDIREPISDKV